MSNQIYRAPNSDLRQQAGPLQDCKAKKLVAVFTVLMYLGPVFGLAGTVIGMAEAFSNLASNGKVDAEVLAQDISVALLTTVWGGIFSLVGVVFVLLLHYHWKYRAIWFYKNVRLLSCVYCLLFPIGTIIGLWIFLTLGSKKNEYLQADDQ